MKRNKGKKALLLSLILMMTITLMSACGNNNDGQVNNSVGSEPPAKSNEVKELSLFIDASWYPVKEWTGAVAEKITEKTGIKLKVTVATDDKQLPLMIASGDLPDLVFTNANIERMSDSKLSYPWNELIEKYAPDFKIDPIRIAIHTMDDGNFYT
ncbi:ABC transporter substrate-binding protein, partial [Paenibacillus sp. TAF58]